MNISIIYFGYLFLNYDKIRKSFDEKLLYYTIGNIFVHFYQNACIKLFHNVFSLI